MTEPSSPAAPFLIAIDPGLRHVGVAVFAPDGTLRGAACVRERRAAKDRTDPLVLAEHLAGYVLKFVRIYVAGGDVARVVAEWPRVYTRAKSKGDPNDLLPLSACSAACATALKAGEVQSVHPDEWKGQAPTETVIAARVLDRLEVVEARVYAEALQVAGKTLGHNVTDAVGIGLHALGRLAPHRAVAR